jgi:hypothetical protein
VEFRQQALTIDIEIKEVLVEAYNSVGKVKRYHAPLRRVYQILGIELPNTPKELILQMAIKAVNDLVGPDGIVPTLLVFGAYPRMTKDSPLLLSIIERAEAIHKAIKEVRRLNAKRQVKEALAIRNGLNTKSLLTLLL